MTTETVTTLTAENFEEQVLKSEQPVLVDFWAPWCGPCRMVGPAVEELAVEFDGQATVAKLNVDDHPEVAAKYGIQGIPALLFFRGGKVVAEQIGAVPKQMLADKLRSVLPDA